MNTLQNALAQAFPQDIERLAKEERRAKFERAAGSGKKLLERAAAAVNAGKPGEALKEVRKDRYACACSLAKNHKRPVRWAFGELERMETLLATKAAEPVQTRAPAAKDSATARVQQAIVA